MNRAASSELLAHLAQATTTTCRLLKITLQDGRVLGFSNIDIDVIYNDGVGPGSPPEAVTYVATNGFNTTTFSADTGYSVDNAEAYALISNDTDDGITINDVATGALYEATWVCYLINWKDLTMGHMILDAGSVGQVMTQYGMVWLPE